RRWPLYRRGERSMSRRPALPNLSATAARLLRTLRDTRCSTGEPLRIRMLDNDRHGWISWHAGYSSGPQSLTVRRPTFERLHRLGLVEYDKDDPNGGKLYKLTPLGSAALRIYDLESHSSEQQNDQKT